MKTITLRYPKQLTFGKGCVQQFVDDILARKFKRIFVVTFREMLPALEESFNRLKRGGVTVATDLYSGSEPTLESLGQILKHARAEIPDTIVGIGGGSCMDVAKVVAAQLKNEQTLTEILGTDRLKGRSTYLVCLPTTAGTGSEVSPNAIFLDPTDNLKKAVVSPYLIPDASYVDPLLTLTVPSNVTAAVGIDALTHCIEAYTNKFAHSMVDLYALEGVRLISANLKRAVEDGKDEVARENLSLGSLYGGFCLGPVNTAAVHALAYPLGGKYHISHGLSNAVLLPYVLEYNLVAAPERYATIARAIGAKEGRSVLETAKNGIKKIKDIIHDCGIPSKLSELNIPQSAIADMAESAMSVTRLLKNNIRTITLNDVKEIYQKAF